MQQRLREEFDADTTENYAKITDFKTEQNQYEVLCGVCGKIFYADRDTHESVTRAIELGLDNPFLCDECRQEYDELAYAENR